MSFSQNEWQEEWDKLKAARTLTFDARYRRRDGTTFPVEITANFLHFDEQDYLFLSMSYITARKAADARIRRLNENLEHRVIERTNTLHQEVRERKPYRE